jgi:hypothetical protein
MLVSVTSFGSLWRHRFSGDQNEERRFAQGVYYNTTGVCVGGLVRQRQKILGYARFHQCGGFDPHHPSRMVGRVFDCAEPCIWTGTNKLLFRRALRKPELPDKYFVAIRSESVGRVQVGTVGWRSPDTWVVAFSECRDDQEMMFLMPAEGWISTELGRFAMVPDRDRPWRGRLVLTNSVVD